LIFLKKVIAGIHGLKLNEKILTFEYIFFYTLINHVKGREQGIIFWTPLMYNVHILFQNELK